MGMCRKTPARGGIARMSEDSGSGGTRTLLEWKRNVLKHAGELGVRLRELDEEIVVEKFTHRDVLGHALASTRFHHEFSGEVGRGRGLERAQDDGLVQRVAGDDGPVIEV